MTNLALSWGISGNHHSSSSSLIENHCRLCHKTININCLHKTACAHKFCAFCGSLSLERCFICGSSDPPQVEIHDNTPDSKLPY